MTDPEPRGRHAASATLGAARARSDAARTAAPRFQRERRRLPDDLRADLSAAFDKGEYCTYCGGIHPGLSLPACPRIASFELDADGKMRAAAFWPDGEFDTTGIYFAADAED